MANILELIGSELVAQTKLVSQILMISDVRYGSKVKIEPMLILVQ